MGILTKILQEENIKADDKEIGNIIDRKVNDLNLEIDKLNSDISSLTEEKKIISKKISTLGSEVNLLEKSAVEFIKKENEPEAKNVLKQTAEKKIDLLKLKKELLSRECDIENIKLSKHRLTEVANELESTKKILSYQNKVSEMKKKIDEHGRTNIDIISKIRNEKSSLTDLNNGIDFSDPDDYARKKLDQIKEKMK